MFKDKAPKQLGTGKWSVKDRGYKPNLEAAVNISASLSGGSRSSNSSVVSTMSGRSKSSIRTVGSNSKSSLVIR